LKSDFDLWLGAQITETGPFTIFIVLVRIADDSVIPLRSSYAHMIGDEMTWHDMRTLLDNAGTPWDGVAFYIGLDHAGGPLPDKAAAARLKDVEAELRADPLVLNRGLFFDREGRHMRIDEVETTAPPAQH
jgi:hypothetical protein